MTRYTSTVERAGHNLRVSFRATPGDPGRTSGPPERCYPPEPPEFEIERSELQWSIPDNLSPQPRATRPIWLDVTGLLLEVGGDSFAEALKDELLNALADDDEPDDPPSRQPDDERDYQPRLGDEE